MQLHQKLFMIPHPREINLIVVTPARPVFDYMFSWLCRQVARLMIQIWALEAVSKQLHLNKHGAPFRSSMTDMRYHLELGFTPHIVTSCSVADCYNNCQFLPL